MRHLRALGDLDGVPPPTEPPGDLVPAGTSTQPSAPHDVDAERGVLGALFLQPERAPERVACLVAEHFFDLRLRAMFRAIRTLIELRAPLDYHSLDRELRRQEQDVLVGDITLIDDSFSVTVHFDANVARLQRLLEARAVHASAMEVVECAEEAARDPDAFVARRVAPLYAACADALATGWPVPERLLPTVVLPEFPADSLPRFLREIVVEGSTALQVPQDVLATLGIVAIATAAQRRYEAVLRPGFVEPLSIFAGIFLPPATRKSAAVSMMRFPLARYEADALKAWRQREHDREPLERVAAARLADAEKILARAENPDEVKLATTGVAEASAALAALRRPAPIRLIVDDTTSEALAVALFEQGGALAGWSCEGALLESAVLGRYTQGKRSCEVLLQAHACDPIVIDRRGRPPLRIERPTLSLALMGQPAVLESLASDSDLHGRGVLGRFVFCVPRHWLGTREIGAPPVDENTRERYAAGISALLAVEVERDAGQLVRRRIQFDAEARHAVEDFERWIEPRLADGGEFGLDVLRNWAGKAAGLAVRLAALLEVADHPNNPGSVRRPTAERAIAIVRWALAHACSALHPSTVPAPARALADRIERGELGITSTRREIIRKQWSGLADAKAVDAALAYLEARCWLRLEKEGKSTHVRINPRAIRVATTTQIGGT